MIPSNVRLAIARAACLGAAVWFPGQAAAQDADIIMRNGRIWTGDTLRPYAAALAIRGERLIAVGSTAEIARHRTPRTRVIDLRGRFVTPGFIDDHTHFNQAGALLIGANLLDVSTPGTLAMRVKDAVRRMSPGAWLTGGDWGAYEDSPANSTGAPGAQRVPRFSPDRTILDSVSPNTPVLLNRWDRSAYLANAAALERAGLSCARPVPGLECVDGRTTGRVADSALARVRGAIAQKTFDQRLREARAAQLHLAQLGVTTIHDITPPFQLPVYTELKRRGELTVRVFARPTLDKWNELTYAGIAPGFGDDWIRIRALKGFVDGIQGNSTARFYEPQLHSGKRGEWRDSTNTAATEGPGSGMLPAGNMERLLFGLDSAGWWANVHAIVPAPPVSRTPGHGAPHRRGPPRAGARHAPRARPPTPRPPHEYAPPTPRDHAGTFGVRGRPTGASDCPVGIGHPTVTAALTALKAHERDGGHAAARHSALARSAIAP